MKLSTFPISIDKVPFINCNKIMQGNIKRPIKSLETNVISADIFILNCNIFSPGYAGMIHMNQGEYSFSVDKVRKTVTIKESKVMPFIKTGDRGRVILSLNDKVRVNDKDRIILRNSDPTKKMHN